MTQFDPIHTSRVPNPSEEPGLTSQPNHRVVSLGSHRAVPSFTQAAEQGILCDVTDQASLFGLALPTLMTRDLSDDIANRLPGELGGFTTQQRLEVVVAQSVLLLNRAQDHFYFEGEGEIPFREIVRRGLELEFDVRLPLLAEKCRAWSRTGSASDLFRGNDDFAPYTLRASLEYDSNRTYALILALQQPFCRDEKSTGNW